MHTPRRNARDNYDEVNRFRKTRAFNNNPNVRPALALGPWCRVERLYEVCCKTGCGFLWGEQHHRSDKQDDNHEGILEDVDKQEKFKFCRQRLGARLLKQDAYAFQVGEGLYLGSYGAAQHKKHLLNLGITHMLCISMYMESLMTDLFDYKHVQLQDDPNHDIRQHFEECFDFINKAKAEGGKVLIYCFSGRSRSATIAIAHLMRYKEMTLREALVHCQNVRCGVEPNFGFLQQLRRYQEELNPVKGFKNMIPPDKFHL